MAFKITARTVLEASTFGCLVSVMILTIFRCKDGFNIPHANQPFNVSNGGPNGIGDPFLRFNSDGTTNRGSRLVVRNTQWSADLTGMISIEADVKNFEATALMLRIAIDGPGGWFATNNAIPLPANADWTRVVFSMDPNDFAAVGNATDINVTMASVSELRLLSNASRFQG